MKEKHFQSLPRVERDQLEAEMQTEQEQQWNECRNDMRNLARKVFAEANEKMGNYGAEWFAAKQCEISEILKNAHPEDYDRFIAYHCLIGSTRAREYAYKLDFPEPLSVKSLLNKALNELDTIDEKNNTGDL